MIKLKKYFMICLCLLFLMLNGETDISHSEPVTEFLDSFLDDIKNIKVPSYTLAEDFPQEHVKTFHDFLLFCIEVNSIRGVINNINIFEHPFTIAWFEKKKPVRYEEFLAAIPMSISFIGFIRRHDRDLFNRPSSIALNYVNQFSTASGNSFFVEKILEPLSYDLKNREYRGYRFKSENIPQFFRVFADDCYEERFALKRYNDFGPLEKFSSLIIIPEEIYMLNHYAKTFLLVHEGELREAYRELYRFSKIPNHFIPDYQYIYQPQTRPLPPRPYYFCSDEDRYLWFMFLQGEMRSLGHTDFADEILETEIEHYRELINWQLQLRTYLTQKLYEYGDDTNLLTLS